MGLTSLKDSMDSYDWLHQGTISDENTGTDSAPLSDQEDVLACSPPLMERQLIRPQHEQALKCPRCESTNTKFCYYNNYSLSQPRYFCKTCRRYWTKGGTLRNIPVGGGCRKNKKVSPTSKKSPSTNEIQTHKSSLPPELFMQQNYTDLQLQFPDQMQFSSLHTNGLLLNNYLLQNTTPFEFMENNGFMPNAGLVSSFGMQAFDHNNGIITNNPISGTILESSQRLMLPYDHHNYEADVKPNTSKILSLEWNDHQHQAACNSDAGLGSWTGMMNAYGYSNALV